MRFEQVNLRRTHGKSTSQDDDESSPKSDAQAVRIVELEECSSFPVESRVEAIGESKDDDT